LKNQIFYSITLKTSKEATAIGESAEKRVKETLEDMGWKSEYEGGNGDLIDTGIWY
jgi:hypothetical protein